MIEHTRFEDEAALLAIEALERGDIADVRSPRLAEGGTREVLVREHLEVLGLLPYALEPVEARAELKNRILDGIAGRGRAPTVGSCRAPSVDEMTYPLDEPVVRQ